VRLFLLYTSLYFNSLYSRDTSINTISNIQINDPMISDK